MVAVDRVARLSLDPIVLTHSRGGARLEGASSKGTRMSIDLEPDALREKYQSERDKRVRADANEQYVEMKGQFAHYLDDPYVAVQERPALHDEVEVAIIGGGFGGLLVGARLREAGIDRAAGLCAAIANDKDNLLITMTARALRSDPRIVGRCTGAGRRRGGQQSQHPEQRRGHQVAQELEVAVHGLGRRVARAAGSGRRGRPSRRAGALPRAASSRGRRPRGSLPPPSGSRGSSR